MAQNSLKMAQKIDKIGSEWGFMTFIFMVKKVKIDQKGRKLNLKWPFLDPKMPSFRAQGEKIPENTLFCPKFMPETIFDGFWAFLRFFDFFSTFLTNVHGPQKVPMCKSPFFYTRGGLQKPKNWKFLISNFNLNLKKFKIKKWTISAQKIHKDLGVSGIHA